MPNDLYILGNLIKKTGIMLKERRGKIKTSSIRNENENITKKLTRIV